MPGDVEEGIHPHPIPPHLALPATINDSSIQPYLRTPENVTPLLSGYIMNVVINMYSPCEVLACFRIVMTLLVCHRTRQCFNDTVIIGEHLLRIAGVKYFIYQLTSLTYHTLICCLH